MKMRIIGSFFRIKITFQRTNAHNAFASTLFAFGIFSQKGTTAEQKLRDSGIKVVIMDAIPRAQEYYDKNADWLSVLPIDELFAEAILEAVTVGGSISGIATRKKGGSRESR